MRQGFRKLESKTTVERIEYLSDTVSALNGTFLSQQTAAIREEATQLLVSIPGHAKYYRDRIESLRAAALATSKKTDDEIGGIQDAGGEVVYESDYRGFAEGTAFPVLGLLPSAETVSVLGHFLADPEGRDDRNLSGGPIKRYSGAFHQPKTNAEWAAVEIRRLGIEHPPLPVAEGDRGGMFSDGEVDAWLQWWKEIEAGKRTYRFIGSSVEYGPDGPASAEAVQRNAMNRKRDRERSSGSRKPAQAVTAAPQRAASAKPLPLVWIVAGSVSLAAAGWYLLNRRKDG